MRFVSTKTIAQQEVEAVLVIRTRLIKERTALLNQSRGLLAEQGKALRQGPSTIKRYLKIELLNDTGITPFLRELLGEMQEHLQCLEVQLARQEVRIKQFAQRDAAVRRLMSIPGLGTLSAVALSVCCGNVKAFKNGRQFAAWLGLVPRQFSSGGKAKLSGITKRGDSFMRTLLIHGARAVIRFVKGKTDRYSLWVQKLLATKGTRITAVALANKNARIAWRLLTSEQVFDAAFQLAA
jgi:transposase